ncbi:MAG TPA: hypothetical protein P5555_07360 [Candidatus Paceibacterota bacterium]|nr:hypothetical protein [Verrucomicrobiota bacterium]HRZ44994.1 hypothetical protein [Candidatus Paceibacterota bacterium]HRZ99352.1 hypothetical protein [Candidatus Paceibacterota bacterium]
MGNSTSAFKPLEQVQAEKLEQHLNRASTGREVLVIDPEQGIQDSKPLSLISPSEVTNGLVRYRRHYGRISRVSGAS